MRREHEATSNDRWGRRSCKILTFPPCRSDTNSGRIFLDPHRDPYHRQTLIVCSLSRMRPPKLSSSLVDQFLPARDALHSAVYAVVRCMSLRPTPFRHNTRVWQTDKVAININKKPYIPRLSNGTTFTDLDWPLTGISKSRYFSTLNIAETTSRCTYDINVVYQTVPFSMTFSDTCITPVSKSRAHGTFRSQISNPFLNWNASRGFVSISWVSISETEKTKT